ncbi:Multifunctional CCA protein [Buchnera aphidicola (Cinara pseudotaxifoliae)]|uniref:CCA-adding enzyme n=1 Tax=Buchnera aphidicola (Cinara pseudotaxifoliae) TaxID=655384 RepID=A0A451DG55_9GAMM|nr:CCA-adding protein [Buchnera aphidicola]VFP85606.1 Multifunctional CCA protein [Buchnera aphidicola (Cinara pseudotaxifoliae)]
MKIYLVGGAIRDRLLGFPVHDRDWVVVGSTPQKMLKKNYLQVGKDFPVFIHPKTREEYALARTEKKNGVGYSGFLFDFSSKITLREDLIRRDLTINAIAQDKYGNIIDLFNGQKDIKKRILRHVSSSFIEDPVRVLRVARFAATLSHLGFYIAKETLTLMKLICKRKELLYLTPERIWKETYKGLCVRNPHVYFKILYHCNALLYLFPEINFFYRKTNFLNFHVNYMNILQLSLMELSRISKFTMDVDIRFSYFLQFISYVYSISDKNIEYCFFYKKPIFLIKSLCTRLKIPKETQKILIIVCGFHNFLQNIINQNSKLIVDFFDIIDVWRKPDRLKKLIYLEFYGTTKYNYKNSSLVLGKLLISMFSAIKDISVHTDIDIKLFQGIAIKHELYRLRVNRLNQWRKKITKNF